MGEPFHPAAGLLDRLLQRGHVRIVIRRGVLGDTLLNARFLVRRHLALHFVDDEREAGLGVGRQWAWRDFTRLCRVRQLRGRADASEADVRDVALLGDLRAVPDR